MQKNLVIAAFQRDNYFDWSVATESLTQTCTLNLSLYLSVIWRRSVPLTIFINYASTGAHMERKKPCDCCFSARQLFRLISRATRTMQTGIP